MNLINRFLLIFSLIITFFLKSEEFLYPVAYDKINENLYIIHQKSLYSIELLTYNFISNQFHKALLSIFLPGGLKLLPDGKGFSFIDQGKLRIKYFYKRAAKTINFNDTIFDMSPIEWVDSESCYFTAKKRHNLCIFQANINSKKIKCIQSETFTDCIYPQKIDKALFYIERLSNDNYKIIKTNFSKKKKNKIEVWDNKNIPIAFLFMKSENEGYFIEHPEEVNRENKIISFTYCKIHLLNDHFVKETLFSFIIPICYLFGTKDQRLYESILPFLPKHNDNNVFYCSCSDEKNTAINIFSYNLLTKEITKKINDSSEQIFFSPIVVNDKIYYGKLIDKEITFEDDMLELPYFQI